MALAGTIQDEIYQQAVANGVDPAIALGVAQQESQFNPNAMGSKGEVGVFQIMPSTASMLGINPYDISQNIQGGITYLKQLLSQFGNYHDALAAYNAGPGKVNSGNIPNSTVGYVSNVLSNASGWSSFIPDINTSNTSPSTGGDSFSPTIDSSTFAISSSNSWLPWIIGGVLGLVALALYES